MTEETKAVDRLAIQSANLALMADALNVLPKVVWRGENAIKKAWDFFWALDWKDQEARNVVADLLNYIEEIQRGAGLEAYIKEQQRKAAGAPID